MNAFVGSNILIYFAIIGFVYILNSRLNKEFVERKWLFGAIYGVASTLITLFFHPFLNITWLYSNSLIISLGALIEGPIVAIVSALIGIFNLIILDHSFSRSIIVIPISAILGVAFHYFISSYIFKASNLIFITLFAVSLQLMVISFDSFIFGISSFLTPQSIFLFLFFSLITGLVLYDLITIRRFSEKAKAKSSEENYKYLLDKLAGIVLKLDHHGRITYANNYLLNIKGLNLKEIKGKQAIGVIFSENCEDIIRIIGSINDFQELSYQRKFDSEILTRGGDKLWFSWDCKIAEDNESNQLFEILLTGIDITERKRVEIVQHTMEQQFRLLHEGLLDSYVRVDSEGRIVDFNNAYLTLTGYDANEIVKLTYNDLTPEKWHSVEKKIIEEQILVNGYSDLYEKEYIRSDGSIVPVELRTYLLKNSNNGDDGFWAIIRDISSRKEIENKLKEANEKNQESAILFQSLLNAIPDTIGVQKVDKTILFYNEAGYNMFGLNTESVKGKKCYEFIGKSFPCETCATELVLKSKKPESVEKFIPEMNIWIDLRSYPVLDSQGEIKYIIEHLHDITIRKNNELALIKSEKIYRNLVEKSSLAMLFLEYNIHNRLVFTNSNQAANFLLNIDPTKSQGVEFLDVFPFFENFELIDNIKKTAVEGTDFIIEQISVQVKKSIQHFEIRAFQAEPRNVVLLLSDITNRINDKEELLLSEQKFRTVITENPMVFFIFDKNGIFTLSEGQGLSKLGLKPGQVVGLSVFDFYKDFPEIIKSARISLKGESIKSPIKVGDLVYDTVFTPYFDQNKMVKGVLGVAYDITSRVNAEKESEKKSEELESYFNNSLDLLCIADLEGYFRKVNPEWGRLLGFKAEELIGVNFFDFIHPDDIDSMKQAIVQLSSVGRVFNFINRFKTKQDKYRWIEWRAFLDNSLMYAVARDISERKIAEEMLLDNDRVLQEQNEEYLAINEELNESNQRIREINEKLLVATEKALESDRLKSAFLANMSHEIRTPMNGIVGFCQLLKQTNPVNDQITKYCDIIYNSSNQLLSIINDIIDISKIEAGQVTLSHSPVSINKLVEKTTSLFQVMANQNNVKLTYLNGSGNPINIFSDETKISQILSNLINNAIKFAKDGIVEVSFAEQSKHIKVWVKDNGIGIAKENQEMIFDRFRQVDGANPSSMKGTGLGLSISKSLVELLGGELSVNSDLGKGSIFTFTIPNIKVLGMIESETTGENIPIRCDFGGLTILLAEDDNINLLLLRKVLENANSKVLIANNGAEALELVKKDSNIRVVLMDIKMPVMDGIEATLAIKALFPNLPIIAQTAYALPDEKKRAIQAGCDAYLTKPINISLLYKTLNQYI